MKHGTGFIVPFDVDETFVDGGIAWLACAIVTWPKGISPSHVQHNPTFGVISTTNSRLWSRKQQEENDFLDSLILPRSVMVDRTRRSTLPFF